MKTIKTNIIPTHQEFVKVRAPHELDRKAICIFAATGFFLESDTYWKDQKILPPGTVNTIDAEGYWVDSKPWFQWHYTPRNISFDQAVKEFTTLFHTICKEQIPSGTVLLPLSGGLDSRSQAVAYSKLNNPVISYSYSFQDGYKEGAISKQIAKTLGYEYRDMTISKGYLWSSIEALAAINECYAEFTHPRQMAVLEDFRQMQGVFSLGHGGDLFFDRGVSKAITPEEELPIIYKQVIKKGGMELATALWKEWNLEGSFEEYLESRLSAILDSIKINNSSAKLRAFKSMTYVPRWSSVNLSVFKEAHPFKAPYFDDRMCEFICAIPEEHLADRKIQIAYLKQQSPKVAAITWQDQRPYNLYNYHNNKMPYNLPYRVFDKMKREINAKLGKRFIQRNWELQFLGMENDIKLQGYLFDEHLYTFISKEVLARFYNNFKSKNDVMYSHPLSMLLTLAVWHKQREY